MAFIASNKFVFPEWAFEWHFLPLLAPYTLLAAHGLARVYRSVGATKTWLATLAICVLVVAVFVPVLTRQRAALIRDIGGRESLYAKLAGTLATEYGVHDATVAATEVGAFGYFYDGKILDTSTGRSWTPKAWSHARPSA